jgi:hypothetical protein
VKTSLKLLIVFAEYTESNALLILSAVTQVDRSAQRLLWSNAMKILKEMDSSSSDVVLLIITLFNTVLSVAPDQDTFYDMTDALEKQGMQRCTQFYLNKKPAEPELVEQFNIYDVSLRRRKNHLMFNAFQYIIVLHNHKRKNVLNFDLQSIISDNRL